MQEPFWDWGYVCVRACAGVRVRVRGPARVWVCGRARTHVLWTKGGRGVKRGMLCLLIQSISLPLSGIFISCADRDCIATGKGDF
jgi:hypothetical protein